MTDEPWRLVVAGPAARNLERLPAKYATPVVEALGAIAAKPHRLGMPLRFELTGRWAARRGPYRIVYAIDDESRTVTVLAVAHRADVCDVARTRQVAIHDEAPGSGAFREPERRDSSPRPPA